MQIISECHIVTPVKAGVTVCNSLGNWRDKAGVTVCNSLGNWRDKAGAYGIQEPFGARYIKKIDGDYNNIVGLPVARLYQELKDRNLI